MMFFFFFVKAKIIQILVVLFKVGKTFWDKKLGKIFFY